MITINNLICLKIYILKLRAQNLLVWNNHLPILGNLPIRGDFPLLHVPFNTSSIEVDNNYMPRYVEASYSIGTTELSQGLTRPGREADHTIWYQSSEWVEPYLPSAKYPVQTESFMFYFSSFTDWTFKYLHKNFRTMICFLL